MHIEAITVCVGYSDFLSEAVPFNRPHFDRWLIVTAPDDDLTRGLCHSLGLECLTSEEFTHDGADFDKARGVDHGLMVLSHKDWLLHIDADMVLPARFRESLEDARLDPSYLYGADRFMVHGRQKWERLKASGYFHRHGRSAHHNICFPEGYPVGARWADDHQGYAPIGAFQLWNSKADMWKGIRTRRYFRGGHNDAARTDMQFALQWPRSKRILLPEVVCAHLESERSATGSNWRGRTTASFDLPVNGLKELRPCS